MIFPQPNSIKQKRKILNITQKELARMTGFSQSLIAKIESGKISASYEIITKIFNFLDSAEKKEEKKCSDIMKPHVITLSKKSKVREAVEIMKRRSISQIPIVEKDHMIGSISEAKIYDLLSENSKEKIFEKRIEEIMEEPFPTLNKTSPISLVMPLLKFSNALIITQQGKIIGIVTKSDVI